MQAFIIACNNKFISVLKGAWYGFIEPISLKLNRRKFSRFYINKNRMPKVSICIPTYNRCELLVDRALNSIFKQSYKNFEILIVGDSCTDKTEYVINSINDKRIRFLNLNKRNKNYPNTPENNWLAGPVDPLNKCLKMVTGDWIARIDDDDTWTDDHIEKLLDFAVTGDFEFVSGLYMEERYGNQRIIEGVHALDKYYTRMPLKGFKLSPKIGGVSTWLYRAYLKNMQYNKDCWKKDWNRVNDIDLSLRIYQAGARIGFIDEVLAFVLPRPGEDTIGIEAYKKYSNF